MLRALFKQGSFWTITNEKTFKDLGHRILQDKLDTELDRFEINQIVE